MARHVYQSEKFPRGTWVRFMSQGRLVIGCVECAIERTAVCDELVTDAGCVSKDMVLEARHAPVED